MRSRHNLIAFAVLAICAITAAFARAVEFVLHAFEPATAALARFLVPTLDLAPVGGRATDPALLNSLRHEAGQHRRSAPRNT